jgi:VCPO second helical-bundle domain/Domain of unknown function (DUF6851)
MERKQPMTTTSGPAPVANPEPPRPGAGISIAFDLDNGNFIRDLVTTNAGGAVPVESAIGPMDASIYIWITHMFQMSWFDALAPYHPTAVGVHSRIPRRPASEATIRNKNIAGLYAGCQVLKGVFEERVPVMRLGMTALGLDPDDESEDPATPVGIGNIAGKAIVRARLHDGMNILGDEGRKYNGQPYDDYTGYQPVNTAYELADPSRWQPAIGPHRRRVGGGLPGTAPARAGDKGIFIVQRFVTPQLRLVKPYTYKDPDQFEIAPPDHTDHTNASRYKQSVDEMLAASAGLTDEQKVMVEFFDNKLAGITLAPRAAALAHDLDLDGWCHLFMTTSIARFDDLIACWHQKVKYDSVRPFSAIRHVYDSTPVTAWGGPYKGTVSDIPASEWSSYPPVADHPEYPSGSTTLCAAEAQAARRFLGDDVLDWTHAFPAHATLTEPGFAPASDVELRWPTWTDFTHDCAYSRVWAGVHFVTTVERSIGWGAQFGDRAYEFVQRHINGDVAE